MSTTVQMSDPIHQMREQYYRNETGSLSLIQFTWISSHGETTSLNQSGQSPEALLGLVVECSYRVPAESHLGGLIDEISAPVIA